MSLPHSNPKPLVGLIGKRADYPPGSLVVLYVRVSGDGWKYKEYQNGKKEAYRRQRCETLDSQAEALIAYCRARGLKVIAVYKETSSGRLDGRGFNRPELLKAVRHAKAAGAVVVAENAYRILRNAGDEKLKVWTPATVKAFNAFAKSQGVRFATQSPSCVPDSLLRSIQIKRGLSASNSKANRKPRKRKNGPEERRAMFARRKDGETLGAIAKAFGVSISTVRRVIKEESRKWGFRFGIAIQTVMRPILAAYQITVGLISYTYSPQREPKLTVSVFHSVTYFQRE